MPLCWHVTQSFCSSDAPVWFAYQDGGGPWTRVLAGANNTYAFQLFSARGGIIPVADFAAAEAFAPATANVTVTGLATATDSAFIPTVYSGTSGSSFGILTTILRYVAANGAVPYDAIPVARLNASELQQIYAINSTPNSNRFAGVFFRTTADRTLSLAAFPSTPIITRNLDTPYTRPRMRVDFHSDSSRMLSIEFAQTSLNRSASLMATGAYTGGGAWDLVFPDLSGAAGWNTSWALQPGTPFRWGVTALGGAALQFDASIADGATYKAASNTSLQAVP
jgi:hypothetical protein